MVMRAGMRWGLVTLLAAAGAIWAQATLPIPPLPADFPKGMNVSVSGDSVSSLLSQLTQQTQITFSVAGGASAVDLTLKDVPLWEAVRRIQDAAGRQTALEWRVANGPQLVQQFGEPFSHAGAFVQRISSITHHTDFGRAEAETYYVNLATMSDPGTRIVALRRTSNPARVLDDAGNSLVPEKPAPGGWNMVADRDGGSAALNDPPRILLQRPKLPPRTAPGRTIKLLEGSLPVLIATRIDSLRLKMPAHELKSYGDVGATITWGNASMGANFHMLEVQLTFARPDTMGDEEWERAAMVFASSRVRMLKPDGTQVATQSGGESTSTKSRHATVLFTPPTDDPNPTVLIEIPVEYREVPVPYHFENVPLP